MYIFDIYTVECYREAANSVKLLRDKATAIRGRIFPYGAGIAPNREAQMECYGIGSRY